MKKHARLLALALVLLSLAACDGIGLDPVSLGPSISGTIVDKATLAPITGATITIAGRQGTSGPNGAYFVADLTKGTQTLKVTKEGYTTFSEEVTIENGLTQKTVQMVK